MSVKRGDIFENSATSRDLIREYKVICHFFHNLGGKEEKNKIKAILC